MYGIFICVQFHVHICILAQFSSAKFCICLQLLNLLAALQLEVFIKTAKMIDFRG
jgi:hypothetical protein